MLYQALTNRYDVLYLNNLFTWFVMAPTIGMGLSRRLFGARPHNCFRSRFGKTKGPNGPAECGEFWYQWLPLPTETDFLTPDDVPEAAQADLRATVSALINQHHRPIVFKHMGAGQKLQLMARLFPGAVVIFCKRDPFFTAQSLLQARGQLYGDRTRWWSVRPRGARELRAKHYAEQVVMQTYMIEKQIHDDLGLFGGEREMTVSYAEFCSDPDATFDRFEAVMEAAGCRLERRPSATQPTFHARTDTRLEASVAERIRALVAKLDWKHYVDATPADG